MRTQGKFDLVSSKAWSNVVSAHERHRMTNQYKFITGALLTRAHVKADEPSYDYKRGYIFGAVARAEYKVDDIAATVYKIGKPTSQYDKGFIDGINGR